MGQVSPLKIPALFMRGGTSKGVFFNITDLPESAQTPGPSRDALLLRMIGSPDPYGKHIDGMGGGISSNSKAVILEKSTRPGHDVDYLFGQPAIDKAFIDWSGNCGNLLPAVGACAIHMGIMDPERIPENGSAEVRIWQKNIGKTINAYVPIQDGMVLETGDFELDGVAFPGAEIGIEFMDPVEGNDALFPTGHLFENLDIPGIGSFQATMINAGIPIVLLDAEELGFQGTELQDDLNGNAEQLSRLESIRQAASLAMGLTSNSEEAAARMHTPKIAFCAPAQDYQASSGKKVTSESIDLCIRAISMGKMHHAIMGTASVAIGTAAAIPGTIVTRMMGGKTKDAICFGHPSGKLEVAVKAHGSDTDWRVQSVRLSRTARIIMEGFVRVPGDCL